MDTVEIRKINEVFMTIETSASIKEEIKQYFAFRPEGYKFNPKYRNKIWDGFIYLYNPFKNQLYLGLAQYIKKFCEDREYELIVDPDIDQLDPVEPDYALNLAKQMETPFAPRDYQQNYIEHAIAHDRAVMISPTSSGKSFIIFLLMAHYMATIDSRILIVVPTIPLVNQMAEDFGTYGFNTELIHKIKGGVEKDTDKQVVITTWQSITKQPKEWFDGFDVVFGDEAHKFAAKSLISIMERMTSIRYRFGLTGTLKDSKVHKLVLEGLFGPVIQYVNTKQLMDEGSVADLNIKCLVLNYNKDDKSKLNSLKRKEMPNRRFHVERDFINEHHTRNIFIRNLLWSMEGKNNLIIFDQVEKHGRILEPLLRKEGRQLHFVHGGKDSDDKDEIRRICESSYGNDILASSGVFSTGISIKRLDNMIYVSGGKSSIKVLQSIGRLLRKGNGSDNVCMYDIMDNLTYGGKYNYFMEHSIKRVEMYKAEQHKTKIIKINI